MKKSELKELIDPIVRECVNENIQTILLESGLLSQVISEVVKGLQPVIVESKQPAKQQQKVQFLEEEREFDEDSHMREILKRSQSKKVLSNNREALDNIGRTAYKGVNIFEGIKDTVPDEPAQVNPANPLQGIAPNDAGVDISGLLNPKFTQAFMKGTKK
jgi:uncharacterized protein with von Willebrand factor type A (vWA) domain